MGATLIIGDWDVNPKSNEISNHEQSIRLSPLAMDVLLHLAAHAGEVVSTAELIDRNWPINKGSDNALYKVISELRRCFNDKDRRNRKIESVAKRGYRLTLMVKSNDEISAVGQTADQNALLMESIDEGQSRLAVRNYTLAMRHFSVALELCHKGVGNPELEAELNLLVGHCVLQEQGKDSAERYFIAARDIALDAENHGQYARALLGLSGNLQPVITPASKGLAHQLQLAFMAVGRSEHALALRLRARIISHSYPISQEIMSQAEQVVTEARSLGELDILIYSLLAYHECLRSLGHVQQQTALSEEIFTLAKNSVDRDLVIVGYLRRISDFLVLGDNDSACALRVEMEFLKPKILFQDELNRIDACFSMMAGDFDEAEQFAMAISFRESGYLLMQFLQLITIARYRRESGKVLPLVESVAAGYADVPAVRVFLALLYADVGQFSATEVQLGKLGGDLAGLNQDISWHAVLVALSEIAYITNNTDLAHKLLPHLENQSGYQLVFTTVCVFGPADFYIGLLQETLGNGASTQFYEKALEQCEAIGHAALMQRLTD